MFSPKPVNVYQFTPWREYFHNVICISNHHTIYTLSILECFCQLYLNKAGKKKKILPQLKQHDLTLPLKTARDQKQQWLHVFVFSFSKTFLPIAFYSHSNPSEVRALKLSFCTDRKTLNHLLLVVLHLPSSSRLRNWLTSLCCVSCLLYPPPSTWHWPEREIRRGERCNTEQI